MCGVGLPTYINGIYNTLPLSTLHQYEVMLLFVHKCMYRSYSLPVVFNDYFQLNNRVHSYVTRSDKTHLFAADSSYGTKCIKFKGCLLWNNLPRSLTEISSHAVFKRELKTYLLHGLTVWS